MQKNVFPLCYGHEVKMRCSPRTSHLAPQAYGGAAPPQSNAETTCFFVLPRLLLLLLLLFLLILILLLVLLPVLPVFLVISFLSILKFFLLLLFLL